MPYYVYKIHPPKRLEYVEAFENYRPAKTFVRTMRETLLTGDDCAARIIFAATRNEAERLLKEVREARPLGEDS
jgi:hypothetical protein